MDSLQKKIENELLDGLNEVQKKAVLHHDGPLLILAGAGSGKTRVITHRIAHLTRIRDIPPWRIAAVTFTNKAVREMRERLQNLIGPMADDVYVRTFHSLGLYILRRESDSVGLKSSFTVYDDGAQKSLIKQILKDFNLESMKLTHDRISAEINRSRDALISPDEYGGDDPESEIIARVYEEYIRRLRENNAVDFGDLLYETVRLFQRSEDVRDHYQRLWQYFLIDEYQDTNHAQYMLGKLIAEKSRNIAVVGDDDQSIYSWRGADISNILSFEKDYPDAAILRLEENYRSSEYILRAASSVIANNKARREKTLFTTKEGGDPVQYRLYDTDNSEVDDVLRRIRTLRYEGYKYRDMAIFYRTNAQSRSFEQSLQREGVPYALIGGFRFFDRKEIKDLMAYLQVIVNPDDAVSLERIVNVPARKIGTTSQDKLRAHAMAAGVTLFDAMGGAASISNLRGAGKTLEELHQKFLEWRAASEQGELPSRIAKRVYEESGYQEMLKNEKSADAISRQENIMEFIGAVREYEDRYSGLNRPDAEKPTLEGYLQDVSLLTTDEDPSPITDETGAVYLMTLHNAKGLEFPVVFLTGLEENLLPHSLSISDENPDDLEEERRLLYVGITRARERLFLSGVRYRRVFGSVQPREESRFVSEIDRDACEFPGDRGRSVTTPLASHVRGISRSGKKDSSFIDEESPFRRDTEKFRKGDYVLHEKYGQGRVLSVEDTPAGEKIAILFREDKKRRNFLTRYTPLRRLDPDDV